MPELPEVETVRRGLEPAFVGQRLTHVEARRPDLRFPLPEGFRQRLQGRTVTALDRRAKYILVRLDSGEILLMHLGMTGRFWLAATGNEKSTLLGDFTHDPGNDPKHDHVVFETTAGLRITYNDARRFGFMDLIPAGAEHTHALLAHVGVEPLGPDLTADLIAAKARCKKADLKAFLMDQRIVAGLGNIYVCEVLFRAGLSPTKPSGRRLATAKGAPTPHAAGLPDHIRAVLNEAIAAGGSTLRDYKQADGALGYFQHAFAVYGREGEPCTRPGCSGTIKRIVQSNRSTFYCPVCQR
jgi:formamidopyrimidine-DNA glycosylase